MRLTVLAAIAAAFITSAGIVAHADEITGTFSGAVSRDITDSGNLFGLGSSTDVHGQAVSGSFSFDLSALSPVNVIPQGAGQTDYSWTNDTGAVSITMVTGVTTTTVTSSVSGGVFRADRLVNGIYQLFEVFANDGTNHAEEYFVSPTAFLTGDSLTTPNYVFTLPNANNTLIGESYLTVGSEQVVFIASNVSTAEMAVPEPGTFGLVGFGLVALTLFGRRARSARRGVAAP